MGVKVRLRIVIGDEAMADNEGRMSLWQANDAHQINEMYCFRKENRIQEKINSKQKCKEQRGGLQDQYSLSRNNITHFTTL